MRSVVALAAALGCGATPAHDERPLTPADVGLPDEPELAPVGSAPAIAARPPAQARFFHHQDCPERRGCVLSIDVTDERVERTLRCRHGASYRSARALRRLDVAAIAVEPDGAFDPRPLRQLLRSAAVLACFATADRAIAVELRGTTDARGAVLAVDTGAAASAVATCVAALVRNTTVPGGIGSFVARLDYRVDDPRAFARPLACP